MIVKDLFKSIEQNCKWLGVLPLLFILSLTMSFQLWSNNYYVNDGSLTNDIYTNAIGDNANNAQNSFSPKATLTNVLLTYGPSGSNVLAAGDTIFVDAGLYFQTDENLNITVNGLSIVGAGKQLTEFDNNMASADANRFLTISADNIFLANFSVTGYNRGTGGAFAIQFEGVANNVIDNVQVYGNNSGGGSSAILINGGSEVTFNGGGSSCNPSPSAVSVAGGGVNVVGNGNEVTFNNYGFSNNSKDLEGGSGLYVNGDNTTVITVNNCVFEENVNSGGTGGGALFALNGALIKITWIVENTCTSTTARQSNQKNFS